MTKAGFTSDTLGQYDFIILKPITERVFEKNDWYSADCEGIPVTVTEESYHFVGFMWELVEHLLLNDQDIF